MLLEVALLSVLIGRPTMANEESVWEIRFLWFRPWLI